MAFLIYFIITSVLLFWYTTRNYNHWKDKNVPFPKPLPLVGNIIDGVLMRFSFGELFQKLYHATKGPILGFYIFNKPCLLIRHPELIKRILVNDFNFFHDRNVLNNKRDDPIGTHILFFLKNPEWKDIRTKITPVYSSAKIKAMSLLIAEAAGEMTEFLAEESLHDGAIEMRNVAVKYTVNVMTSTAFGVNANSFQNDKSPFYVVAKRIINWDDFGTSFRIRCYFLAHSIVKIFRLKLLDPMATTFLHDSFWAIMNHRVASGRRRGDLIDILLQMQNDDKNFLKGDVLTSQAVVFFVAGFETSSTTIALALHELACNPKIQTKLRNEINEVSRKHGGINYESLEEMVYLDMCCKETLRKYPAVPVLERKCNSRYTLPEVGTVIENGTAVFISVLALHHDPEYFPRPEVFDPERFSAENKALMKKFTYLPFGDGPRNCIGARFGKITVKVAVATIVKNFILELSPDAEKIVKFNPNGLALCPLKGVRLNIKKV